MKHIIIGGDGFVGQQLARMLTEAGERVIVADIARGPYAHYARAEFLPCDITDPASLDKLPLEPGDAVYNLSAKMLSPLQPRAKRHDFFFPVNFHGVEHLLKRMEKAGARDLVQFTTDMVYGHSVSVPQFEDHPKKPLGEYGLSKLRVEEIAEDWREKGFRITLFRPRLIIGPGRLGILTKLFKLIDWNLPVPMIGSGRNPYQFISVYDCATAAIAAWKAGFPNEAYNLGSLNPPPVRKLLGDLVRHAGSRSILLPTPAWLVKRTLDAFDLLNRPIMDPEQYLIADEICILDVSKAERELGWVPQYDDAAMLIAAYNEYRKGSTHERSAGPHPSGSAHANASAPSHG
jgi:dTDP-glucose 4,6-dehydratase